MDRTPTSDSAAADPPVAARSRAHARRRRASTRQVGLAPVLWTVAVTAAVAASIALLYAASVHADPASSDGATVVLEGQSMAAGHLTLHGWSLSLDSFWTVDALLYAVAVLVAGVRAILLDLVPAILAVGVVVTAAMMARDGRRGTAGAFAALTVVALLDLPGHVMSVYLLKGPLHIGTALLCLGAFACLRTRRFDHRFVIAAVLMAAGILGDVQMISLGVVPVMLAGLVQSARARAWRPGLPAIVAGPASIVVAVGVRLLAEVVGTFSLASPQPRASWSQVPANIAHVATLGAQILGVGASAYGTGGVPGAIQAVHVIGLAAVLGAVLWGSWGILSGAVGGRAAADQKDDGFLDDVLVIAFFADCATFVLLASSSTPAFGRYLTAGAIFGSISAGRALGAITTRIGPGAWRAALAAAGIATMAAFGAGLGYNLAQTVPVTTASQLGQFLASHDLHLGVGDYWSASIVTVVTDGSVVIRPVIVQPSDGEIVRYGKQSTGSWYSGQAFQFLVFDGALPFGGVNQASATHTFGRPTHIYRVGSYYVLTFAKPITVSPAGFS